MQVPVDCVCAVACPNLLVSAPATECVREAATLAWVFVVGECELGGTDPTITVREISHQIHTSDPGS
jgi:hypothetical protein